MYEIHEERGSSSHCADKNNFFNNIIYDATTCYFL